MKRDWIVPPGLRICFDRFREDCEDHFKQSLQNQNPFLIHGQTGVGKSLFVEYYRHELFKRLPELADNKPRDVRYFNCATITPTLAESELFGYKRGSHYGAAKDKKGLFDVVGDGLLVLEEIGELSFELQAKLLTVIEEGEFHPLGSEKPSLFKGKVIATTNVVKKRIRPDLWHRLDVFKIPPVHMRRIDVLYYLLHYEPNSYEYLTTKSALALIAHEWTGNVREIENFATYIRRETKRYYSKERKIPGCLEPFNILDDMLLKVDEYKASLESNSIEMMLIENVIHQGGIGFTGGENYFDEISDEDVDVLISRSTEKMNKPPVHERDAIRSFYEMDCAVEAVSENIKYVRFKQFDDTFLYFCILCGMTFCDVQSKENALSTFGSTFPDYLNSVLNDMTHEDKTKIQELFFKIFISMSKLKASKRRKQLPFNKQSLREYLDRMFSINANNEFLLRIFNKEKAKQKPSKKELFTADEITEKELLRYYYHYLLRVTNGNKAKAARLAGKDSETLLQGTVENATDNVKRLLGEDLANTKRYHGYRIEIIKE